jgi:AAA domain
LSDDNEIFGNLEDVRVQDVKYLWRPYIPIGLITMLEGDPNVGKSYLAMHIVAQLTRGGELPGGSALRPGDCLYLSTEDEPEFTIRPRIEQMGGDVSRVRFLVPKHFPLDEDGLLKLKRELEARPPKLLVFDTLFSFLPAGSDSNKPTDVRAVLSRVSQLASDFGIAVLVVRHWTKGDRGKAIYRGAGSIDIIGLARSAIAVGFDPEDQRVMVHLKHNLSTRGPSLVFDLVKTSGSQMPVLSWKGESPITPDELQAGAPNNPKMLDQAIELLREQLKGGEVRAKAIQELAQTRGISDRTLERAKKELGVKARKKGSAWFWSLPK